MNSLPTKAEDELLTILTEECAEVIQAIAKIKRHGWDSYNPDVLASPDNRDHFEKEVSHVLVLIGTLMDNGVISEIHMKENSDEKVEQLKKYTHFQEFSIDRWTDPN